MRRSSHGEAGVESLQLLLSQTGGAVFCGEGVCLLYEAGFIAWLGMLVCAILNGLLREQLLQKVAGKAALPLSSFSGAVLFTLVAYIMFCWLNVSYSVQENLFLGLFWFFLTILFECAFGRWALKKTWRQIVEAYDIRTGNLWCLLLLYILALPYVVSKLLL